MAEPGVVLRGVDRVARGRQRRGNRVTYLDVDGKHCAPERLVMNRCRRAGFEAYRLQPSVWRRLGQITVHSGQQCEGRDEDVARAAIELAKGKHPKDRSPWPRPALVVDLFFGIPTGKLGRLMVRHLLGEADQARPGVPDLVVFKRAENGRPKGIRFVEVKRPGEPLMPHQRLELHFLRDELGLKAGVLRLIERP